MPAAEPTWSIPDYELLRQIGVGGYGEVWLARSTATGALRAVKFVRRATFTDAKPFEREFAGLLKFEAVSRAHPSQLALFHVGRDEAAGWFYYVMELADPAEPVASNQSPTPVVPAPLRSSLTTDPLITDYSPRTLRSDLEAGRLPAARVLELGLALTEALAHLHGHGLVHRDVKPSNLIFVNGRPKLADIGLVTDASDARSFVGTEGYLPPEGPGTPAADIFALGKVLYEALTGLDRRQFPELPADLRQWPDAALAFELNAVLVKACAADARKRYASAEALRMDLERLAAGRSVRRQRAQRKQLVVAGKILATIAVLALAVAPWWLRKKEVLVSGGVEVRGTTNHAAWEALQRANEMGRSHADVAVSNAVVECERAVALDPNFAEGWVGLANWHFVQAEWGKAPPLPLLERALAEVEKATRLNPSIKGAYGLIASCKLSLDYDFAAAEPLYLKAIQIDPSDFGARGGYASALEMFGRFPEAESLRLGLIRDAPSRSTFHWVLGQTYGFARKYDKALAQLDEAILLDPNNSTAHSVRGDVLWAQGNRAEAAQSWLRGDRLFSWPEEELRREERALDEAGPEGLLNCMIAILEEKAVRGEYVSSYELAKLHGTAGHKSRALHHLERAVDEHRGFVLSAKVHLAFKDFQGERRYHAVLRRLKLE